jgi:hypothetical protein
MADFHAISMATGSFWPWKYHWPGSFLSPLQFSHPPGFFKNIYRFFEFLQWILVVFDIFTYFSTCDHLFKEVQVVNVRERQQMPCKILAKTIFEARGAAIYTVQPGKNTKNNIIICIYFLAWEALYNIVNILALSYKCRDISPHFLPQTDKRKGFKFSMLEFHTILWFGRFAEYKLLFTGVKTCMKLQCGTIFKRRGI